jgi:hypothetical protein
MALCSSRIDAMQSELRETAHRICGDEQEIGAMGSLITLQK